MGKKKGRKEKSDNRELILLITAIVNLLVAILNTIKAFTK